MASGLAANLKREATAWHRTPQARALIAKAVATRPEKRTYRYRFGDTLDRYPCSPSRDCPIRALRKLHDEAQVAAMNANDRELYAAIPTVEQVLDEAVRQQNIGRAA